MANDLNLYQHLENEISMREIVKLILDSKKLFIATIIVFTLLSVVYSFSLKSEFKSSIILEIGYYEMPDGTQRLIEKSSDLISYLNLYQFMNIRDEKQEVSLKAIENKLILIETTSKSGEQNENLLVEIFRNIGERHSNLTFLSKNQKKEEISRQIEMIESQLSFIKAKVLDENQLKKLSINRELEMVKSELSFIRVKELSKIEDRLAKLTNELPVIDIEISQLERIIHDDTNNLSLLKENNIMLIERAANSPTLEQVIFTYKTQINALNRKKSSYILEIQSLNNQVKILENDTSQSDQLFRLEQEKVTLENDLQVLMNQTQVNTRLITNIATQTIKPKTLLTILLGIILGFITGITLTFIIYSIKSFKESKA